MAWQCRKCWLKNHPDASPEAIKEKRIGWDLAAQSHGTCEDCKETTQCVDM